jgi:hypothetical protein
MIGIAAELMSIAGTVAAKPDTGAVALGLVGPRVHRDVQRRRAQQTGAGDAASPRYETLTQSNYVEHILEGLPRPEASGPKLA